MLLQLLEIQDYETPVLQNLKTRFFHVLSTTCGGDVFSQRWLRLFVLPNVGSTRGGFRGKAFCFTGVAHPFFFIGVAHLFFGGHADPCDC